MVCQSRESITWMNEQYAELRYVYLCPYEISGNGMEFDGATYKIQSCSKVLIEYVNRAQWKVIEYAACHEFLKRYRKELHENDAWYSYKLMHDEIEPTIKHARHGHGKLSWACAFGIHRHKPITESDVMLVCRCGHAKIDYKRCR